MKTSPIRLIPPSGVARYLGIPQAKCLLTDNEGESVRALIENQNISPAFVQRLVREHGCAAIGRAYLIGFRQTPHLAWLLRRFKGKLALGEQWNNGCS